MADDLQARVQLLVDRFYGGVNAAAARGAGLPQPTLWRILKGEVTRPRLDVLQRLASHFSVPIEWLIEGRGDGPLELPAPSDVRMAGFAETVVQGTETPGMVAWRSLLRSLPPAPNGQLLDGDALLAWTYLPVNPVSRAFAEFVDRSLAVRRDVQHDERTSAAYVVFVRRVLSPAYDASARAWLAFVTGLLAVMKPERVVERMIQRADSARMVFDLYGEELALGLETAEGFGLMVGDPLAGSLAADDLRPELSAADIAAFTIPASAQRNKGGRPKKAVAKTVAKRRRS